MDRKETGEYMRNVKTNAARKLWKKYSEFQIQSFADKLVPEALERMALAGTDISKVILILQHKHPLGGYGSGALESCILQSYNGDFKYDRPKMAYQNGQNLYRCLSQDNCPLMQIEKDEPVMCGFYVT